MASLFRHMSAPDALVYTWHHFAWCLLEQHSSTLSSQINPVVFPGLRAQDNNLFLNNSTRRGCV